MPPKMSGHPSSPYLAHSFPLFYPLSASQECPLQGGGAVGGIQQLKAELLLQSVELDRSLEDQELLAPWHCVGATTVTNGAREVSPRGLVACCSKCLPKPGLLQAEREQMRVGVV